jgi:hypothetical protein
LAGLKIFVRGVKMKVEVKVLNGYDQKCLERELIFIEKEEDKVDRI